jgi:hypothetical protein
MLAVAALLVAGAPDAADRPGVTIQAPHYGEVLFHFYQQDDFGALTRLLAARDSGRLGPHATEAELLLGGLYLGYGQHREAGDIFSRLLAVNSEPEVRDRAWFYLGKVRYQRGLFAEAEAALRQVGPALPSVLTGEHRVLLAQALMGQARFREAARLLDGLDATSEWQAYGRINLGVALVRAGDLSAGAQALDVVGTAAVSSPELLSLRDKANLALGYARLQANEPALARPALARVRLDGPFSSKALLGVGWADAALGEYRRALAPWLALRDRDMLDSAVQESLLAVPYAYARLDAQGSAIDQYLASVDAFDTEIARLDAAIGRARDGTLLQSLLSQDDSVIARWYWQLDQLPESTDTRYLYHLVAQHQFQDGLRDVRDLQALRTHLARWQEKMGAFTDMIEARRQAYEQRLPAVSARLGEVDPAALQARRDELAARLASIEQTRDVVGLATAAESDAWHRLAALAAGPGVDAPEAAGARDRVRVLRGMLLWDLDREYKYRLWRQRRSLAELDTALETNQRLASRTLDARSGIPADTATFEARILSLTPRVAAMQSAVAAALGAQTTELHRMAVLELEAQRERLAAYRVQARFALATLYDRASATAADAGLRP